MSPPDLRDPFYASTLPQIYAVAATTVLSYTLVIVLLITPRTFFIGGTRDRGGLPNGRGIITGATGSSPVIAVGRRPWLQKVAALTVAISLTMATASTFSVANEQYETGYMNATELREDVVGGMKIRIVRVISDVFLWLAQAQTLVRLFPRHKEKIIIKWTAATMILFYTIFSILNNFVYAGKSHLRSYRHAIPALSYLFQLALSLLYAAWVLYYSFVKRRFAFFHRKMWNICMVAALALTAILVPVIFFVLDISKPDFADWGDYVRWVGAAAASVVVWEWVERIEALEREEVREGILGREMFDGDQMLDAAPSAWLRWPGNCQTRSNDDNEAYRGRRNIFNISKYASTAENESQKGRSRSVLEYRTTPSRRETSDIPSHNPRRTSALFHRMSSIPLALTQPHNGLSRLTNRTQSSSLADDIESLELSATNGSVLPDDGDKFLEDLSAIVASTSEHEPVASVYQVACRGEQSIRPPETRWDQGPLSAQAYRPNGEGCPAQVQRSSHAQPATHQMGSRSTAQLEERSLSGSSSPEQYLDPISDERPKSRFGSYAAAKATRLRERLHKGTQQSRLPVIVVPAPSRAITRSAERPRT